MPRRTCDNCGTRLEGRLGHGMPTPDGRGIRCLRSDEACEATRTRKLRPYTPDAELAEFELQTLEQTQEEED